MSDIAAYAERLRAESPHRHLARDDEGLIILTHRRPHLQWTLRWLLRARCPWPIRLLVDDCDPTLEAYRRTYGDLVVVFDKRAYMRSGVDRMDNFYRHNVALDARHAAYDAAIAAGWSYFCQLDDDYDRLVWFAADGARYQLSARQAMNLTRHMFDALRDAPPALGALSLTATSEATAGLAGLMPAKRYVYHRARVRQWFWLRASDRWRVLFRGTLNDDINVAVGMGRYMALAQYRGALIDMVQMEAAPGGMTDAYQALGSLAKALYSMLLAPMAIDLRPLRAIASGVVPKTHTRIDPRYFAPWIVASEYAPAGSGDE